MKKYFENHETSISISLIIIYVVLNSYCIQNFSLMDYRSVICNFLLSLIIIIFIAKNRLGEYYGLTSFPKFREFLYFIPLFFIISCNFWNGINIKNSIYEIICYILCMICIGFLEEIIFRGFLFKMMAKENVNRAAIVSALTFGIGHIVNLFNGADIFFTLMQIGYSITLGFLFVTIFEKGKCLVPCIITHVMINTFSIFNNFESTKLLYVIPIFLIIISISYSIYLIKNIK